MRVGKFFWLWLFTIFFGLTALVIWLKRFEFQGLELMLGLWFAHFAAALSIPFLFKYKKLEVV